MLPVMDTGNRRSQASRKDYLQRIDPRYQKASRPERQRILESSVPMQLSPQACHSLAQPSAVDTKNSIRPRIKIHGGPDTSGLASSISSSCHHGVFVCPDRRTAEFGAWLPTQRQRSSPWMETRNPPIGNTSLSGSPLVTVM